MKLIKRKGKIVGCQATPDDEPTDHDCNKPERDEDKPVEYLDQEEKDSEEQSSGLFTAEDRLKYSPRGHIPGSVSRRDGKIVTNPGLRHTGENPNE